MKKRNILISLFFVILPNISAIQVSGFVRDNLTGEVLIGANIFEKHQNTGTTTDNRGYFSLKLNSPNTVTISYIGYQTQFINILSSKDSLVNINLKFENNLNEVLVTASQGKNYDVTRFSAKDLSQIPTIGGKPDVIKALQLLPGVQTHSEGMSIMMVRGGEPGQNQYLLDNVPLIYVNHLGGLLSVFNPDMINTIDFYKGNFPARHGGKLSSIVDITQRDGNISKHLGSFNLGLTDASFSFEGPLANNRMSFIVTVRKTLIDGFFAGISTVSDGNYAIAAYGFHDINAKISWKPDEKNNFSINLYQGDDYLNYWTKPWKMKNDEKSHIYQQWGNWMIAGRWNYVFNSKLFAENIISYNRYRNKSGLKYNNESTEIKQDIVLMNQASINDFSVRSIWKYSFLNNWQIEFGGHAGFLVYKPNYNFLSTSSTPAIGDIYHALESAIYLDNKIKLFSGLIFQPSLRLNNFYNNGENFPEIEPRFNLTYKINSDQSLNINYMHVSQNSHLIFAQTELLKREVWLPATSTLLPEISNQLSLVWNGYYSNSKYSTETTIYYKKMEHLVTLKEGYENMINIKGVENKIETEGYGIAYGSEFMLKKNTGKWTGSLSYAWSNANRTFENINDGKSYEFDFNRPHCLAININRNFNNNWSMCAVWILQSGNPYTPALGKQFTINPETGKSHIKLIYGKKNSGRMQPYHRLDIGFNHTTLTKKGNRAIWTYSIYNVYNHINPFNYYYDNDNDNKNITYYNQPLKLYKTGLFTFIPSVSYKVFFDYCRKSDGIEKSNKKKNSWLLLD